MADEARTKGNEPRLKKELRVAIRRARERLQLSQEDFAQALGRFLGHPVSQSQISDWERGRFEPSASVLLAVAELADLSVDELRGTGPRLWMDRLDRLEDQIERLTQEADHPGPEFVGRLEALEAESQRIGELLAQIVGYLDVAGLWPAEATPFGVRSKSGRAAQDSDESSG
jgi:transcriptional regulator with XRE-family HTH domain